MEEQGALAEQKVLNLSDKVRAKGWTRQEPDSLGIGADLEKIPWGTKQVRLPPSRLKK